MRKQYFMFCFAVLCTCKSIFTEQFETFKNAFNVVSLDSKRSQEADNTIVSLNKHTSHKIVVATMQKTGSHLINKCISLITGQRAEFRVEKVDWCNNFYWVHPNGGFAIKKWLNKKYRLLTMIRDPRDHIVSIMRHNQPPFNQLFTFEEIQEGITAYLTNFAQAYGHYHGGITTIGGGCYGTSLNQIWAPFIKLLHHPHIYIARFEKLIGPQGNGVTREEQFEEINNIAQFIGVSLTDTEIEYVADCIYGDTVTFVKRGHNTWKKYFTEEHKKLCKASGGDALIQLGYEDDLNW